MTNKYTLVGYKPLDEFTLEDYARLLKRLEAEGRPLGQWITLYNKKVDELRAIEKKDYLADQSIKGLTDFIKKYSKIKDTSHYQPQYLEEAIKYQDKLIRAQKKKKKRVFLAIAITFVLVATLVIIIIGYEPITYFSYNTHVTVDAQGGEYSIIDTNAKKVYISIAFCDEKWLRSKDWYGTEIEVDENDRGYERSALVNVSAYPTFFGVGIDFMEREVEINVTQKARER